MLNANKEITKITKWIQKWFAENGPKASAVIGISGGKDSTIIAALLVKALGRERVVGVLMPDGEQKDIDDAKAVVDYLQIDSRIINIKPMTEAFQTALDMDNLVLPSAVTENIPPRVRMTTLYAVAQSLPNGGRVANTCNRSEDYVGYSTKYGDAAGDFSPCNHYTVTEMLEIGDALGLPKELVHKTPSDGLCGQTDEDKLGFKYADLDQFLLTGKCSDEQLREKFIHLHKINLHKLEIIPSYTREE